LKEILAANAAALNEFLNDDRVALNPDDESYVQKDEIIEALILAILDGFNIQINKVKENKKTKAQLQALLTYCRNELAFYKLEQYSCPEVKPIIEKIEELIALIDDKLFNGRK
jgi:seryl-tRNA(Sec) selenium transferase